MCGCHTYENIVRLLHIADVIAGLIYGYAGGDICMYRSAEADLNVMLYEHYII